MGCSGCERSVGRQCGWELPCGRARGRFVYARVRGGSVCGRVRGGFVCERTRGGFVCGRTRGGFVCGRGDGEALAGNATSTSMCARWRPSMAANVPASASPPPRPERGSESQLVVRRLPDEKIPDLLLDCLQRAAVEAVWGWGRRCGTVGGHGWPPPSLHGRTCGGSRSAGPTAILPAPNPKPTMSNCAHQTAV